MGSDDSGRRRRRRLVPAVLATAGLLAVGAVVARDATRAAPDGRPTPIAFAAPSDRPLEPAAAGSGCGHRSAPGSVTVTPTVRGKQRTVRVHLPGGYTGQRPLSLLLNLHGTGSTAVKQESITGLDATADAHGFIVAYPQGLRRSANGFLWNVPGTPSFTAGGPDDVAFIGDVVTLIRRRYCVDAGRVYLSGFSGGARMVSQIACTPPVRLAGVVAAAGLRAPSPCRPTPAMSVLAFHGTADTSNPYQGHGQSYWTYSVPVAAQRWAGYLSCRAGAQVTEAYPGVMWRSYRGCRGGGRVELYTLAGKGHRWPLPAGAFVPNEIVWRFIAGDRQVATPAASAS